MTQTFTLDLDLTAKQSETTGTQSFPEIAEPSENTIQMILNYSRNLEVKSSQLVKTVEMLKS